MHDWDSYNRGRKGSFDDPWDRTAASQQAKRTNRRPAQPSTAVPPDGGSSTVTYTPKPKRAGLSKRDKTIVLVIISLLIVGFAVALFTSTGDDISHIGTLPAPEPGAGDALNPDPAFDFEAVDESDFGPSYIERYTDPLDFSLNLSASGTAPLSYQEIYDKMIPSVVSILVYDDEGGACATGIVLSEDGCILTNQHVVAGADEAEVITHDGTVYEALLVGDDENTDLALLKIDAEGLVPAQFATSNELHVGDECFAIGNPMGMEYSGTFSNGIVSAINRTITMEGYTMTLLQTTAALNVGNSGGPLINSYGQVIGVVNMKLIDPENGIEGMGFAIPSTVAKRITDTLVLEGEVEHPVMGITCYAATAGNHEGSEVDGLFVVSVAANSDAAAAGLTEGDIITHVDGLPVHSVADVNLAGRRVGDEISVTVYRDGTSIDLTFHLVEQNELE